MSGTQISPAKDTFNKESGQADKPTFKGNILKWVGAAAVVVIAALGIKRHLNVSKLENFTKETFDNIAKPLVESAVKGFQEGPQAAEKLKASGTKAIANILNNDQIAEEKTVQDIALQLFSKIFGEEKGKFNIKDKATAEDLSAYALDSLRALFKTVAKTQKEQGAELNEHLANGIIAKFNEGSAVSEAIESILAQRIEKNVLSEADKLLKS